MQQLDQRVAMAMPVSFADVSSPRAIIGTLTGFAVKFETWSRDLEQRRLTEKVIKTAFDETITLIKDGKKVVDVYVNHNPKTKITDTREGLRLQVRPEGLAYEVDLPDTSIGQALKRMATVGGIAGVSIGFKRDGMRNTVVDKDAQDGTDPLPQPTQIGSMDGTDRVVGRGEAEGDRWEVLTNVDLREISFLTAGSVPAHRGTSVELKSSERSLKLKQFIKVFDALL